VEAVDGLSGAMRLPVQNEAGGVARAQSLAARAAMEGLGVDSGGTTGLGDGGTTKGSGMEDTGMEDSAVGVQLDRLG